ncbi:MAG: hypothetical protein ACRYFS_01460 [Janthinobacterium lividum]
MMNEDFYAIMPEHLVAAMDARGARKAVIVRDLARYYGLLKQGMRSIDGLFTSNELHFLAEISTSSVFDADYTETLVYSIEDSLMDIGVKWEVDGPSLLDKVRSLDQIALYALMDSTEQFWTRNFRREETTPLAIGQLPEGTGNFAPLTRYNDYLQ